MQPYRKAGVAHICLPANKEVKLSWLPDLQLIYIQGDRASDLTWTTAVFCIPTETTRPCTSFIALIGSTLVAGALHTACEHWSLVPWKLLVVSCIALECTCVALWTG